MQTVSSDALFQEVLQDTRSLLQGIAHPRLKNVSLLKETNALIAGLASGTPTDTLPTTENTTSRSLAALREDVSQCMKCDLCKTRTQTVFGVGNPNADLVFVGEAPGADEDRLGEPFVGKAGQLLTDIIEKGMKIAREDVYICNVLKCRPPENRDPQPYEVSQCEPYLIQQLGFVQPKVIVALGRHATQTLLRTTESTGHLRGKWHNYHDIPLRVTYHPAYLLHNPEEKAKAWDDIKAVIKVLSGEESPKI